MLPSNAIRDTDSTRIHFTAVPVSHRCSGAGILLFVDPHGKEPKKIMTTNSVDPRGNIRRCENKSMSAANVRSIYQIIFYIRVCAVRVEHALVLPKMASNIRNAGMASMQSRRNKEVFQYMDRSALASHRTTLMDRGKMIYTFY